MTDRYSNTLAKSNVETIKDYYSAVSNGDIEKVLSTWADNAIMNTVFSMKPIPPEVAPPHMEGADTICAFWRNLMENTNKKEVAIDLIDALASQPEWVMVRMRTDMELKDGTPYANQYNNLIRLENEKIVEYYEYSNPLVIINSFGPFEE